MIFVFLFTGISNCEHDAQHHRVRTKVQAQQISIGVHYHTRHHSLHAGILQEHRKLSVWPVAWRSSSSAQ